MPQPTFQVTLRPPTPRGDGLELLLRWLHDADPVRRLRAAHRIIRAWHAGDRSEPSLHAAACLAYDLALDCLFDPDPRQLRPAVALAGDMVLLRDDGFLSPREEEQTWLALRDARARVGLALALLQGGQGCAGQVERDLASALEELDAVVGAWEEDLGSLEPTDHGPPGPVCTTPPGTYRIAAPPRPKPPSLVERFRRWWVR